MSTEIVISSPDERPMIERTSPIVAEAQALAIVGPDTRQYAGNLLTKIADAKKLIISVWADPKAKAHAAHRSICDRETSMLLPLEKARAVVSGKLAAYDSEQRRIAEEKARLAEEEARRLEEERRIQNAIEAEQAGDTALADVILDAPPVTVAVAPQEPERLSGVVAQTRWSAEVSDKMALIRYVAEHPEFEALLDPNMKNLNRMAVTMRQNLAIPGVRATSTTTHVVRGGFDEVS